MLNRFLITLCLVVWAGRALANDTIPAEPQTRPVAITNATIHPISGPVIERGWIVMIDGKIDRLGEGALPMADDVEVIDAAGKHVYPGLFDASTVIGLVEIPAVRATRDNAETGSINPNVVANVAVNPDSHILPTTRSNGVLLVNVTPESGLISGQSSIMALEGWTWEQMTLASPSALIVRWPRMIPARSSDNEETERRQLESRDRELAELDRAFDNAEAYRLARQAAGDAPINFDARWEAMIPYLAGVKPVIIVADEVSQIEASIAFAQRRGLKLVLAGASDAIKAIDSIRAHKVPVILEGTHVLPRLADDPIDEPFTRPARLLAEGVTFAIAGSGRHSNARNLPYQAGMAAAYGLSRDEALASITLRPAQILGVADRVGSLQPGKDATLFIASGDILEIPTQVEAAWIQGKRLDLTDKHKQLNEKYRRRLVGG